MKMGLKRILSVSVFLAACVYVHQNGERLLENIRSVNPGLATVMELLHDAFAGRPLPFPIRLYTARQLRRHSSLQEGLYLAILGKVYDVTAGSRHYDQGGDYHGFTGKDASRAFMTGDFTEAGLVDDVLDLSPWELRSVADWQLFYEREYTYVGKVIGRFYNSYGEPTDYLKRVQAKMEEGKSVTEASEKLKLVYPPCNVEWAPDLGTRVWCTKLSGGISRDWAGVPRMMYEPGLEDYRCACLEHPEEAYSSSSKGTRMFKEYEECEPTSSECHVPAP